MVLATDLVVRGECRTAFCAVRPPGHHAERRRAMGFCLFNNVAVGAAHALAVHGLERVAIVDFDVHHGNGTEEIFSGDPRVLMVSTFQHPLYPYSGRRQSGRRTWSTSRCAAGAGSEEFRAAVRERWLPALEQHRPQVIFISAGFDAHREDPLAGLEFVDADYAWVTRELIARRREARAGSHRLDAGRRLCAFGARPQRGRAHPRARDRVIRQPPSAAPPGARHRTFSEEEKWSGESFSSHASRCPALVGLSALPAWAEATPRLYDRARLVDIHGAPLKARALVAETNYIFHYPFVSTPCFLLNLGRPAVDGGDAAPRGRNDVRLERRRGTVAGDRRVLGDLRAQARVSDARGLVHPLPAASARRRPTRR